MVSDFQVRLPLYEGPLELLLSLIEKRELDITQLSLAAVTDDYLGHLRQLEQVDPGRVADFLVIAARLLLIKSRFLLPEERRETEPDEEDGQALAQALIAYRQFKEIARSLSTRESAGLRAYLRPAMPVDLEKRLVPGTLSMADLVAALHKVLQRRAPPPEPLDDVVPPLKVTVRQRIAEITAQLQAGQALDFETVIAAHTTRQEIIASFLALLELVRLRRARIVQRTLFGAIEIEPILETLRTLTAEEREAESDFG